MGDIPHAALILAAGEGKRMRSALPKVLHPVCELPLVCHVVRLALQAGCEPVVVVVSPSNRAAVQEVLHAHFPGATVRMAVQHVAQGTGDAARAGLSALTDFSGQVFLLYGDVPLLTAATVQALGAAAVGHSLAFLTAQVPDPTGYGRVVRAGNKARAIVEDRDCSPEQRAICEINAGVYVAEVALLRRALANLAPQNAQNEYYLTDIVPAALSEGAVATYTTPDAREVRGVNSRAELSATEAHLTARLVAAHQAAGVTFQDPGGVRLGMDVTLARDVTIGMGVQLMGATQVSEGVVIEGPTVVRDSTLSAGAIVHSFSHLEGAVLEVGAVAGPFARLRPEAHLGAGAKVGNFVEVKKARLGPGAKANHLAYVGDAEVGDKANLGAGTITCNYDGFNKHRTVVGAGAFVGSNSTLVAPVTLAAGAFVAAGSVITEDVPADALAFGRARQVNREGAGAALRQRLNKRKG